MWAADGGHAAAARILIAAGADPHAHDTGGDTALTFAQMQDHEEAVTVLLEAQAARGATSRVSNGKEASKEGGLRVGWQAAGCSRIEIHSTCASLEELD